MSLAQELIEPLITLMSRGHDDVEQLQDDLEKTIAVHDELREFLYETWDAEKFDRSKSETYPPCLKDQGEVLRLLDKMSKGLGFAHRLVIDYRYPAGSPKTPAPQPVTFGRSQAPQAQPVVVQTAEKPEAGYRVKSVWTGPFETRLRKMELEFRERMAKREAETRKATIMRPAENIQDPLEWGSQLLSVFNETKHFLMRCYKGWTNRAHRNPSYASSVHLVFMDRVSRMLTIVESVTYAATGLDMKELKRQLIAQTGYFTRILEAQAQTQTTVQEFHQPYSEDGFNADQLLEPPENRRRRS